MIPEDVDAFGQRALVTAVPYIWVGHRLHLLHLDELAIGAEVAVVGAEDDEHMRVVVRGVDRTDTVHRACLTLTPRPAAPEAQVTPDVAAHVLWHYRQIGYPPGSFVSALIRAIAGADGGNRRLLARGFPDYVRAVRLATEDIDGIDTLRRVLETRRPL